MSSLEVEPLPVAATASRLAQFNAERAALRLSEQSFVCPLEGELDVLGGHVKKRNRRKLNEADAQLLQLQPATAARVIGRANAVCDRCFNKAVGLRKKAAQQRVADKENVPPVAQQSSAELQLQILQLQSMVAAANCKTKAANEEKSRWKRRVVGASREGMIYSILVISIHRVRCYRLAR